MPGIYEVLLNEARSKGKAVTEKLLKTIPFEEELYQKLKIPIGNSGVRGAGNKFQIFSYLLLVQDFVSFCETFKPK